MNTKTLFKACAALMLAGGLTACGPATQNNSSDNTTNPSSLTKEQARAIGGVTDGGVDVCQANDWYGDGTCDEFCPSTDTDCKGTGTVCGGQLAGSATCGDGEFCKYDLGAICGAADATGTCEPKPEICTQEYNPVCGCDDQTYSNECAANAAGVSIASLGECESTEPPPTGGDCGGLAGLTCGADEFCDWEQGDFCGAADALGTCKPVPELCTQEYDPVCGCDGVTYSNGCAANAAGVSVAADGECASPGEPVACGGRAGDTCADGEYCSFEPSAICGWADAQGVCTTIEVGACPAVFDPICGCDGQTYSNACEAANAGTSVASEGECEPAPTHDCGGIAGLTCGAGEFCNYSIDAMCGAADQMGTCEVIPDACDASYEPVCGCDGQTYSNACVANSAGVSVVSVGECAPVETICGARAGDTCSDDEYCHFDRAATCGWADATGVCQPKPEICTEEYAPVCGCDGMTYSNECYANSAGTGVVSDGACEPPAGSSCGGFAGFTCGAGEFCDWEQGDLCGAADALGTCKLIPDACTQEYDPVCGCDGMTYSNGCAANAAGVSVANQGACAQ